MLTLNSIQYSFEKSASSNMIRGVNLQLKAGDRLGIVGPNGCGKSTLLKIIASLLQPTSGSVLWNEEPITKQLKRYREQVTYEEFGSQGFYPRLNAIENLRFFSALKGRLISHYEAKALLSKVHLHESCWLKNFSDFSLGMKQRLHLARCLLGDASLILLDEPTNGLDKDGRDLAAEICLSASYQKIMIAVSHDTDFLQKVTMRQLLMNEGLLVDAG